MKTLELPLADLARAVTAGSRVWLLEPDNSSTKIAALEDALLSGKPYFVHDLQTVRDDLRRVRAEAGTAAAVTEAKATAAGESIAGLRRDLMRLALLLRQPRIWRAQASPAPRSLNTILSAFATSSPERALRRTSVVRSLPRLASRWNRHGPNLLRYERSRQYRPDCARVAHSEVWLPRRP